jgi:hypothetical protein
MRMPVLTVLWIAMCGLMLYEYIQQPGKILLGVFVLFVCATLGKLFIFDLPSWFDANELRYGGPSYSHLDATMRLFDFGVMIAFLYLAFRILAGDVSAAVARRFAGTAALVLLFVFLSLEVNTFLHFYLPGLQTGGVSIVWSMFAIGLLLGGIWKDISVLRYVALALFAIVAVKVFFSDLAQLDQIYRIVAFLILGLLVLTGSFLYLKYRKTFATGLDAQENSP